ncbi:hypothetical protein EYF80_019547 [Liparis tanakae]|uniref:Uncharacterized protein n=1 Tax=Liparis tanakae TaxID=230148 RepID=A0A4Z2HWE6_9TELE|nr:hypothetical protein EYF80_019547 [Liparis tanakae]
MERRSVPPQRLHGRCCSHMVQRDVGGGCLRDGATCRAERRGNEDNLLLGFAGTFRTAAARPALESHRAGQPQREAPLEKRPDDEHC